MIWDLEPPFSTLLFIAGFLIWGTIVGWRHWVLYETVYFPARARLYAIITALIWMIVYGGAFGLVVWVVVNLVAAALWRYLVGAILWWLLSQLFVTPLFSAIMRRLLD